MTKTKAEKLAAKEEVKNKIQSIASKGIKVRQNAVQSLRIQKAQGNDLDVKAIDISDNITHNTSQHNNEGQERFINYNKMEGRIARNRRKSSPGEVIYVDELIGEDKGQSSRPVAQSIDKVVNSTQYLSLVCQTFNSISERRDNTQIRVDVRIKVLIAELKVRR